MSEKNDWKWGKSRLKLTKVDWNWLKMALTISPGRWGKTTPNDWELQSRLKFSILTFRIPPTKRRSWWVARLKFSFSLDNFNPGGRSWELSNLWALREGFSGNSPPKDHPNWAQNLGRQIFGNWLQELKEKRRVYWKERLVNIALLQETQKDPPWEVQQDDLSTRQECEECTSCRTPTLESCSLADPWPVQRRYLDEPSELPNLKPWIRRRLILPNPGMRGPFENAQKR